MAHIPGMLSISDIPNIILGSGVGFLLLLVYVKIAVSVKSVRRKKGRASALENESISDGGVRRIKMDSANVDAQPTYGSVERDSI